MAQEVQNVMKEIRLEKVVLNMGLVKSGDAVEIDKKALGQISNKKVNDRPAKKQSEIGESEKENQLELQLQ